MRLECGVLEPVAIIEIVLIEQQSIRVELLHLLKTVLDKCGGDSVEGRRIFGRRAVSGGLLRQRRHIVERVLVGEQIPGHLGGCSNRVFALATNARARWAGYQGRNWDFRGAQRAV